MDDPRTDQFFPVVPGGELAGGYSALGLIEQNVSALGRDVKGASLQGLPVADPELEPAMRSGRECQFGTDPVEFFRQDKQCPAIEPRMMLPLTDIQDVSLHVGRYDE